MMRHHIYLGRTRQTWRCESIPCYERRIEPGRLVVFVRDFPNHRAAYHVKCYGQFATKLIPLAGLVADHPGLKQAVVLELAS